VVRTSTSPYTHLALGQLLSAGRVPHLDACIAPPITGHLECPCTDRVTKIIQNTFDTQTHSTCKTTVVTADECFGSVTQIGIAPTAVVKNATVNSSTLPSGCSAVVADDSTTVYFNTAVGSECGAAGGAATPLLGAASITGAISFELRLDPTLGPDGLATITIAGPATNWFGLGLGAQQMSDAPNAIIVAGNGTVWEQKLADQQAGEPLPMSLTIVSVNVSDGIRTVVVTRPFKVSQCRLHWEC
jgi:hypothetical protein